MVRREGGSIIVTTFSDLVLSAFYASFASKIFSYSV